MIKANSKIAASSICIMAQSEPDQISSNGSYIGRTCIYKKTMFLDTSLLINRHMAVLGMTGSGKSYFLKNYLVRTRINTSTSMLILDWNGEYSSTVSFLLGRTLRLGYDAWINIFDLNGGKTTHGVISQILAKALRLNDDERAMLDSAIEQYITHNAKRTLSLKSLIKQLEKSKDDAKALKAKLSMLINCSFISDKQSFEPTELLKGVVSIDLSKLENDVQRKIASSIILNTIIELMHAMRISVASKRILVLDEAWRFVEGASEVGMLFREARKYGIGIIVATQLAGDINNEIISNAACIAIFRMQSEQDITTLCNMGVVSQGDQEKLLNLAVGSCMLHLAYANSSATKCFFIERIVAINTDICTIKADKMETLLSRTKFSEYTERLDTTIEAKARIMELAAENEFVIQIQKLISLMIRFGIERFDIVCYLKLLGVDDSAIAMEYEKAKQYSVDVDETSGQQD